MLDIAENRFYHYNYCDNKPCIDDVEVDVTDGRGAINGLYDQCAHRSVCSYSKKRKGLGICQALFTHSCTQKEENLPKGGESLSRSIVAAGWTFVSSTVVLRDNSSKKNVSQLTKGLAYAKPFVPISCTQKEENLPKGGESLSRSIVATGWTFVFSTVVLF